MRNSVLYCLLIVIMGSGCGVRRYLPAGERLYRGVTIHINKDSNVELSSRLLKKQLELAARPASTAS